MVEEGRRRGRKRPVHVYLYQDEYAKLKELAGDIPLSIYVRKILKEVLKI